MGEEVILEDPTTYSNHHQFNKPDMPPQVPDKICEMCGKPFVMLDSHHTIPRYLNGGDDDIIQVCRFCHVRADRRFEKLMLDPWNVARGVRWVDKKKQDELRFRYRHLYYRSRTLNTMFLDDDCRMLLTFHINAKSGHDWITTNWSYKRYRTTQHKTRTSRLKCKCWTLFREPLDPGYSYRVVLRHSNIGDYINGEIRKTNNGKPRHSKMLQHADLGGNADGQLR